MKRRDFVNLSVVGAGASFLTGIVACSPSSSTPKSISDMDQVSSRILDISPISKQERKERVARAQELLKENGMKALLLDAGTSLNYFTGIRWGGSERPMVAIIPAEGEVCYISPGFEEDRLKELIQIGKDVHAWQEDESPYLLMKKVLNNAGISGGKIAIEERVRFFIVNGLHLVAPEFDLVSADPITVSCRIIKSASEIALMQRATEITIEAMKVGLSYLKEGGSPSDFSSAVAEAHRKMGASHAFALANFGEASAFPHGSIQPQVLKKGDTVLIDCGCEVDGYNSDISRTVVFGAEPTARQLEIWSLEKEAQAAGFAAAKLGAPLGDVDAAARKVITDAGFGPGYQLPGLPHRTGHGIGMDGHEWGNAVRGNDLILKPGMCFSIEPNISIVGEFGVRLEDCVYMSESGPVWFSKPSPSISEPFV